MGALAGHCISLKIVLLPSLNINHLKIRNAKHLFNHSKPDKIVFRL